jgi:hypothetical protein
VWDVDLVSDKPAERLDVFYLLALIGLGGGSSQAGCGCATAHGFVAELRKEPSGEFERGNVAVGRAALFVGSGFIGCEWQGVGSGLFGDFGTASVLNAFF